MGGKVSELTTQMPEAVATAVGRYWEARGQGRAVSIDEVIGKPASDPEYLRTRATVISVIATQAAVLADEHDTAVSSSERATLATVVGGGPAESLKSGGRLPQIDGYDLVMCLGCGGMGAVYEGYQRSTGRRVAIKLMLDRLGSSHDARQRFEREVEVVARLQHPGIVSVLDSGVRKGQYFYAMEFVSGKPLDAVFVPGKCDVRGALGLIASICDAVDYAHQRGILHRDLKPGNIIIDGEGKPHLLDFGLAKVFDPKMSDGGSHGEMGLTISGPGQLLGTPAYMAPEQAEGKHDETSVRTDVYALGAIAYELITGKLPCPMAASMGETLKRIIEIPPTAPSAVRKGVAKDVDAVLLRALEKSPDRRYATVGELAADIRRYLSAEPVVARRVGPIGKTRRWVRRNSAVSAVMGAAALTIVVVSAVLVSRIVRERDEARENFNLLKEGLEAADPERGNTFVQLCDGIAKRLDDSPPESAANEAELRALLGAVYRKFAEYDRARESQMKALAIREQRANGDDPAVAEALHNLAATYWWDGRYVEAEKLYERSLAMRQRLYPGNHQTVAMSMTHLAACRLRMGKQVEARDLYQQALDMRRALYGEEHEEVAQSLNNLAKCSQEAGDFERAEVLFRQALTMIRKLKGDSAPGTAAASQNLGDCLIRRGDAALASGDAGSARDAGLAAIECLERALQIRTQMYPQGHHLLAASLYGLARAQLLADEPGGVERALDLAQRGVDMVKKTRRADHPELSEAMLALGMAQDRQGSADAVATLRVALTVAEKMAPPPALYIARLQRELSHALARANEPREAEKQLAASLATLRRILGDTSAETRQTARALADLYAARGDSAAAAELQPLLSSGN